MAITLSTENIDDNGKELLHYGTKEFPIAFFDDDLTKVKVPWHWHEEFEICILLEGKVDFRVANQSMRLKAQEGYFINSGILHSEKLLSPSGHQHCLIFSPTLISPVHDLIWQTYIEPLLNNPQIPFIHLQPSVPWQKDILDIAKKAWEIGAYDQKDFPYHVRESISMIFVEFVNHRDILDHAYHYTIKNYQDELRVKTTLRFIETHYAEKITIAHIAKSADISISTCLRLYKSILHTTPIHYLIQYRLQKSLELLKGSKMSISEIAFACGFNDPSYYNKWFKKEYRITPSTYILNLHQNNE